MPHLPADEATGLGGAGRGDGLTPCAAVDPVGKTAGFELRVTDFVDGEAAAVDGVAVVVEGAACPHPATMSAKHQRTPTRGGRMV
jgi:hypothetical protein